MPQQPLEENTSSKSANNSNNSNNVHLTQVAPQVTNPKNKNSPEYIKLPLPSRRSSRTASLKASMGKGSFISLLLCCTSSAASMFDNNDKSSSIMKRQRYQVSTTTTATTPSIHDEKQPQQHQNIVPEVGTSNNLDINADQVVPTSEKPKPQLPKIVTQADQLPSLTEDNGELTAATPDSAPPPIQNFEMNTIKLLPPLLPEDIGRKCLVLDLDETLVHSSFKAIPNPDFIVPVEIDNQYHNVYVLKRPGVDEFMRKMGELYEIVVFTASLSKYADPVLDILDIHKVVKHRLFRESCYNHKGTYVKDLSHLNRDLNSTLILDNSPASYIFHTANAVPVSTWFNDPHDTELTDLISFLDDLTMVDDVTLVLNNLLEP
ncbi:unnamed protein product [Cunninghamella echinulata]